jgi:hypothetical protein
MNKTHVSLLLLALVLSACSLVGQVPTQSQVEMQTQQAEIATRVKGTQNAAADLTRVAPTLTPTPGTLPISDVLLNSEELNQVVNDWPEAPVEQLNLSEEELCVSDCSGQIWRSTDDRSRMVIILYETSHRDQAVTLLQELRQADAESGYEELPIPSISNLPPETWIILNSDLGEFVLRTRQGKAMIEIHLLVSHLDQDQNLIFLGLYAERQVEKLKISGF